MICSRNSSPAIRRCLLIGPRIRLPVLVCSSVVRPVGPLLVATISVGSVLWAQLNLLCRRLSRAPLAVLFPRHMLASMTLVGIRFLVCVVWTRLSVLLMSIMRAMVRLHPLSTWWAVSVIIPELLMHSMWFLVWTGGVMQLWTNLVSVVQLWVPLKQLAMVLLSVCRVRCLLMPLEIMTTGTQVRGVRLWIHRVKLVLLTLGSTSVAAIRLMMLVLSRVPVLLLSV